MNIVKTTAKIMLVLLCCVMLFGQNLNYELVSLYGTPCSYNYTNVATTSDIGCWATGWCYPGAGQGGAFKQASFYQHWYCRYSVVNGTGSSESVEMFVNTAAGMVIFPTGVQAVATALVYDSFDGALAGDYSGLDEDDCNGYKWYSGPMSYGC